MPLVGIAGLAHAAFELHTRALLDHVRGLVRRRVQVRLAAKGDVITRGIGRSAHLLAGRRGFAADMGAHLAQVVGAAKSPLDLVEVRQGATGSAHAGSSRVMHGSRIIGCNIPTALDRDMVAL